MSDINVELCLALIPKASDAEYLQYLSNHIMNDNNNCHIRIGDKKNKLSITPHLTLYQFALNFDNLDSVTYEIEVISKLFKQIKLNTKEFCYNSHEGSFEIKYELTDDLEQIQNESINSLNEFRGSLLVEKTPNGNEPNIEDENVMRYGFRGMLLLLLKLLKNYYYYYYYYRLL